MIRGDFRATIARYTAHDTVVGQVADLLGPDVLARDKSWIAGGAIRRVMSGDKPGADIDIYSSSHEAMDACANKAMAGGFEYSHEVNQNHVLRSGGTVLDFSKRVFYPTADECITHFDYTICQFALFFEGEQLTVLHTPEAIYDLMNGLLMPVKAGCTNMELALRRSRKYHRHGFAITPQTLAAFVSIAQGR